MVSSLVFCPICLLFVSLGFPLLLSHVINFLLLLLLLPVGPLFPPPHHRPRLPLLLLPRPVMFLTNCNTSVSSFNLFLLAVCSFNVFVAAANFWIKAVSLV